VHQTNAMVVAGFSHEVNVAFVLGGCGAFALGWVLSARRTNAYVWLALFLGAPFAALLFVDQVISLERDCTGDCVERLVWGFILLFSTLAWWAGLVAGALVGSGLSKRRSN
jgi:hypothetical protein